MQPDQYPVSPTPHQPDAFDFILKDNPKTKNSSGGSQKQRIMVVVLGSLLLLLIIVVFMAIVSNSGKSSTQSLIDLAEEQTEIIRVAGLGADKARTTKSLNLAATTSLSMKTTLQATINLLKKKGHPLTVKQLALKKNLQTDAQLTAADQNNRFDETFDKIIINSLTTYSKTLKVAYDSSTAKSEKQILADNYSGVNLILNNLAGK